MPTPRTSGATQDLGLRWRKKIRQHNAIVETTVELVRTSGYDGVTVEEIARHLEISPATFYNYFSSKGDVLACWVQRIWDEMTDEIASDRAEGSDVRSRMKRAVAKLAKLLRGDRELWRAIAATNAWSPIEHSTLTPSEERAEEVFVRMIEQAQANGELTARVPAWRLAQQLDGMLVVACANWALDRPRKHSLRRSLDDTLHLFFLGARATEMT